jgi:shikimate kinase
VNTGANQAVGKAIVIVGLMGTGKSSVGVKVARSIGAQFIDTDDLIAQQSGRSVREIFAQDGEAAFRDAEVAALDKAFEGVLLGIDTVISTGGGIVLSPLNRKAIKENASCVIWLDAPVEDLLQRTGKASKRPLLDGDARGTLTKMAKDRFELYEDVATVRIETHRSTVADVVLKVTNAITAEAQS